MEVQQIMTRIVRSCRTWDTLSDAAQKMLDADCGCVPVLADDGSQRVVGMLTDRDICMASHARRKAPVELTVGDVMSQPVRSVGPAASLAEAEAIMREAQIRRLPVVGPGDELIGILALADLAREAERVQGASHPEITEREIGDTLSAISASSVPSQLTRPSA